MPELEWRSVRKLALHREHRQSVVHTCSAGLLRLGLGFGQEEKSSYRPISNLSGGLAIVNSMRCSTPMRLVVRGVTARGSTPGAGNLSSSNRPPRSTQPVHQSVYTGQRPVMLCGWVVKAGIARVWWQVKLCDPFCNTSYMSYLSALEAKLVRLRAIQIHVYFTVSKVIQRLTLNSLRHHLLDSSNFRRLQSAYRRGRSTETTLYYARHDQ